MSTTALRKFLLSPERNGVAGLIFFGWPGSIAFILGGLLVSFLLCGYWYPYWRIADMDIMMGYQGFLVNAGFAQDFFDHPGYLSVVLTADWFALLHRLGLIDVASLAQMPKADDAAAFNAVWTQAIRAGRVLSLLVTSAFIVAFALLLRRLIRDWQIAVRSPRSPWRPLWIGLAAALCTLGVVNKVQALFLVMALLPVILFFGMPSGPDGFWRSSRKSVVALLVLAVFAGVLAYLESDMIVLGLSGTGVTMPPPFGVRGLYQG